jgi:hypothetical protein
MFMKLIEFYRDVSWVSYWYKDIWNCDHLSIFTERFHANHVRRSLAFMDNLREVLLFFSTVNDFAHSRL